MARTKQTKKVKPSPDAPPRKFLKKKPTGQAIVKAKHKTQSDKAARKLACSHKNQRIGLFKEGDMQEAINLYRGSHMPGSQEPLSIRKVAELFKHKDISFGSLQKRLSGEVTTIRPASGGKGKPRILLRDVEG